MKKILEKLKKRGAFTLVEVLIAIALIGILAAVTFIAVITYQRNMQFLEMNETAKELFIAAQNHLSMAEGQGFLGITYFGDEDDEGALYLLVRGNDPDALNDPSSVLSLMLPAGAIDDIIRTGGNYIIRYQKEPARILDVFCAENSGKFAHAPNFDDTEYADLLEKSDDTEYRKKYNYLSINGAVIGYYGGAAASEIPVAGTVQTPSLKVENGDVLKAVVTWGKSDTYETLSLVIKGLMSGAEKPMEIDTSLVTPDKSLHSFNVILDDISNANNHFSDILGDSFLPGEDIEIYATAHNTQGFSNVANSVKIKTNSLFASVGGTSAEISSIRHLENLDPAISSLSEGLGINAAVQNNDLSWTAYTEAVKGTGSAGDVRIYDYSNVAAGATKPGCYMPVRPYYSASCYLVSYNGNRHTIDGIKVDTTGDAGLFAVLSGSEIKDLELVNFHIISSGGNAGALAGSLSSASLSEILVRNDRGDANLEISAANSAGGLVGVLNNSGALHCAASVYVESKNGAAGGLIGRIEGATAVRGCYSGGHTKDSEYPDDTGYDTEGNKTYAEGRYNVMGKTFAGGLVGDASGSSAGITYCYSTCSVRSATPGGFIGHAGNGTISECYSAGKTVTSSVASSFTPFAGAWSGTPQNQFSNNQYLQGMSDAATENLDVATPISAEDLAPDPKGPALPYDLKVAANNIGTGGVSYSFRTVADIYAHYGISNPPGAASFVRKHYGDWQLTLDTIFPVSFYFKTPGNPETKVPDSVLGDQFVKGHTSNTLMTPYPEVKNGEPPLRFLGWYFVDPDTSELTLLSNKISGPINLSKNQCSDEVKIYGLYGNNPPAGHYYNAKFYSYDPDNPDVPPLLSEQSVFGEGKAKNLFAPYPPTLSDHVFIGWYDAPAGGNKLDPNNYLAFTKDGDPVQEAYARYEKVIGDVKVNFVVSANNSDPNTINLPIQPYLLKLPIGELNTLYSLSLPEETDLNPFSSYIAYPISGYNLFRSIVWEENPGASGAAEGSNNDLILRNNGTYIPEDESRSFTVHYDKKSGEANYTLKETFRNTLDDTFAYASGDYSTEKTQTAVGQMTNATAGTYPGFYAEPFVNKPADPNGNTVLEIVYIRERQPILYYGLDSDNPRPPVSVPYGAPLDNYDDDPSYTETPPGHNFKKWKITHMDGTPYNGSTMPDVPLKFTAEWTGQARYMVVYWKETPDDYSYFDYADYLVDEATTDAKLAVHGTYLGDIGEQIDIGALASDFSSVAAQADYEGFQYNKTKTESAIPTIAADGSTVLNVYFDRLEYEITFVGTPHTFEDSYEYIGNDGQFVETGKLKEVGSDWAYENWRPNHFYGIYDGGPPYWAFKGADYYRHQSYYFQYRVKHAPPSPKYNNMYAPEYWFEYDELSSEPQGYETSIDNGYYYLIEYKSTFGYAEYYHDGSGNFYKMDRQDTDGNYIYYRHVYFSMAFEQELKDNYPAGYFKKSAEFKPFTIRAKHGQDIHMLWPSKRNGSFAVAKNARWRTAPGENNYQIRGTIMPLGGATYYWAEESGLRKIALDVYLQDINNSSNYIVDSGYSSEHKSSGKVWTSVPDYAPINGFKVRVADKGVNNEPIRQAYGDDYVLILSPSLKHLSNDLGDEYKYKSGRYLATVYYERQSYNISAYVDDSLYKTFSYPFEKTLYKTSGSGSVSDDTLRTALGNPESPGEGYTLDGWYSNKYYAGEKLFPATASYEMRMLSEPLTLYAKWLPPQAAQKKTVTFNMNVPPGGGAPNPGSLPSQTVNLGVALNTIGTVANGKEWDLFYQPTLNNYSFEGWFTSADGGRRFIPNEAVSADITLYARWKPLATTMLTINHVLWNPSFGTLIPKPSQIQESDIFATVQESIAIETTLQRNTVPQNVGGVTYTPIISSQQVYVTKYEKDPTIYFFYVKPNPPAVTCEVNYYIVLSPLAGTGGLNITVGPIKDYVTLNYKHGPIYFNPPAGYENYHQVDANGSTQDLTPYVISDGSSPAVVTFYMAPNLNSLRLPNTSASYTGTDRISKVKLYIANTTIDEPLEEENYLEQWTPTTTFKPGSTEVYALQREIVSPAGAAEAKDPGEYRVRLRLTVTKGTTTLTLWESEALLRIPHNETTILDST